MQVGAKQGHEQQWAKKKKKKTHENKRKPPRMIVRRWWLVRGMSFAQGLPDQDGKIYNSRIYIYAKLM